MSEPENTSPLVGTTGAWDVSGGLETPKDLTGTTLGDFQVERLLGRGGMGEVYLARQISLNRPVALKVLRPELIAKPGYLGRFEAEATAVAKLNHPNIVHVYMLGSIDDTRFIAMEYVQGTNLREYIQKKGALELPLSLSIMKQAGLAIGAAGEIGLVHRDVKPENLLLTRKGQVKVADFGLCRDQDGERLQLTQPGVTMGTPLYMSPEQAQGHAIDHRSDLYSLGVTFYHMLAGSPPFRADTALAVALKHVKDTPVSLSVHRPDLPPDLVRLVMKLMAKDPVERYQSAAEMLRDLAKVREALNSASPTLPEADVVVTTNGSAAASTLRPPAPKATGPHRTRESEQVEGWRGPRVGAREKAALLLLGLAVGLFAGWYTRPQDLLSEGAAQATAMPALWMVPDWSELISRQATAEAQYHHAQLSSSTTEQEAAWIAVPGYFPQEREYCSKAYVQLARALLRRRELDGLRVFAAELARWKADRTHGQELAVIVQAAVDSLDHNVDGVVVAFGPQKLNPATLTDPALIALALEVTTQASKEAAQDHSPPRAVQLLNETQNKLRNGLYLNANFREPQRLVR